jgi:signal transduction histidine kinase
MELELQRKIKKKYLINLYRLEEKIDYQGTGLGLSIVKRLLELFIVPFL